MCVLQSAVLSPFFGLHTSDLSSESLASFLIYGHPCGDSDGISVINEAQKYVSEWSGNASIACFLTRTVLTLIPAQKLP